jgi:hypothetical protein
MSVAVSTHVALVRAGEHHIEFGPIRVSLTFLEVLEERAVVLRSQEIKAVTSADSTFVKLRVKACEVLSSTLGLFAVFV